MNNKGFTLLEVIMVVAILGIITLILVPNVITLIEKNREKEYENLKNNIILASKIYVSDNMYDLPIDCSKGDNTITIEITLDDLVKSGNLSEAIIDPRTQKEVLLNNKVQITYNCINKEFSYNIVF